MRPFYITGVELAVDNGRTQNGAQHADGVHLRRKGDSGAARGRAAV